MYDATDKLLEEEMKNPKFKKEYEMIVAEREIVQAVIDARKSCNLTQKQLAEITGINQAGISKLERGNTNPTLRMLQRIAEGMNMTLKINFIPKTRL